MQMLRISIVIPAFNEEENVPLICSILESVLEKEDINYDIIVVDDGSTDNTWEVIEQLHRAKGNVGGIKLSRNFGHQNALMAGLHVAKGDAVITMDADLQHPPEVIPQLIEAWQEGYKIVNTRRTETEEEPFLKRLSSKAFYKTFSWLTKSTIKSGMADFRLLDRKVVDELKGFSEIHIFLRGLVQWIGFPVTEICYSAHARKSGRTKYGWRRMLGFSVAGITSFTILPLRISILLGLVTAILAFTELCYVLFSALVLKTTVAGWASTLAVISFLFGILFIVLGVIGEYIGRIFELTKARPLYLVEKSLCVSDDCTVESQDQPTEL
jgi:glycosyltransferase involved in cell wall biosynthesis